MKKIVFITGTRADYGKLKPLIRAVEDHSDFEAFVYVSGMHLLEVFGSTYNEVINDNYKNTYVAYGLNVTKDMSYNFGNLVCNLTGYIKNIQPDMIVVHGDRVDALAGATVGALSNIRVAHIEGGEVSGTIDESIRHAISKFAHFHFVSNEEAKQRLIQLGECVEDIRVIGSPDIDIMLSGHLPSIEIVKKYYEIEFEKYGIFTYHPVTTEIESLEGNVRNVIDALIESNRNYVVLYPNNDNGSDIIINEQRRLIGNPRFRVFPSIRFEYFLTLMKNSEFVIGNSSAGIRETCVFGIPSINIGTRQRGRFNPVILKNIIQVNENTKEILKSIDKVNSYRHSSTGFGYGDSCKRFIKTLEEKEIWERALQKKFIDYEG